MQYLKDAQGTELIFGRSEGFFETAIDKLTSAINLVPKGFEDDFGLEVTYFARGLLFIRMGDLNAARADFARAVDLGNSEASEYLKRINSSAEVAVLQSKGKYGEIIDLLFKNKSAAK
jgi:hypothetical protein